VKMSNSAANPDALAEYIEAASAIKTGFLEHLLIALQSLLIKAISGRQ